MPTHYESHPVTRRIQVTPVVVVVVVAVVVVVVVVVVFVAVVVVFVVVIVVFVVVVSSVTGRLCQLNTNLRSCLAAYGSQQ